MRIVILVLAALAALPTMSSVRASEPPGQPVAPTQTTPPALQPALRHGFRVTRSFSAASGLTGWVLLGRDKKYAVVYTTPDGQTLLLGDLISSTGENLSDLYTQRYAPPPDLTPLWAEFEKSNVVIAGAKDGSKSAIYVIMDPNCIFCHMLWIALKPYEAKGLQVRWIPVGFLHEDSSAKAAAILKGGEPALEQSQQHFDVKAESGGIAGIDITPDLRAKLDSNLQVMRLAGVQGTPGIFYKDGAGHVLRREGMPSMSELPSITGLPAQPETDPQLAQFN